MFIGVCRGKCEKTEKQKGTKYIKTSWDSRCLYIQNPWVISAISPGHVTAM